MYSTLLETVQCCAGQQGRPPRQEVPGSAESSTRSTVEMNLMHVTNTGGPAYYGLHLHPQKGITICIFLTYQAFKTREGIFSLDSQNNLWTNLLIGIQGDCPYI